MSASRITFATLASAAVLASPSFARAQDSPSRTPNEFERRSSFSISFTQSRPMGALRENIGFGYGANGAYEFRLDQRGILSLRGDIGFLGYGQESFHVPLSTTVGGRVQVKVSTTNYLVPMSIGPQLTWPTGHIRPYVNGGIGGQLFFTESNVRGDHDADDIASTTNQSDWTGAWVAGGGLYIPVYKKQTSVLLDIGVQYYGGGRGQYLRPGSIVDLPDSQIAITPLESDTHLMLVRLGVKIGL